jgi:cellulose synthase/poly-beta-1,6-N-acetylglucosamine synthase-like glycosyltransferase
MELGGWDENSLTEDVELAVRLVEKNHVIKYAPDVCSGQETPDNLGSLFKQRVRWYRGYMETALKYGRLLDRLNRKTVIHIRCLSARISKIQNLSYTDNRVIGNFFRKTIIENGGPKPTLL